MRLTLLNSIAMGILSATVALAEGPTVLKAPPGRVDELAAMYKNPPVDYRIQFLLRTNDEVSKEEIDWQVGSIRQQGGGGVFSYCEHRDGGSPERFLTDAWWTVVDLTASACAREGLWYWAYDEEDWPSGTAGDLLLKKHPELTWKYLKQTTHRFDVRGPVQFFRSGPRSPRGGHRLPNREQPYAPGFADRPDRSRERPPASLGRSRRLVDGRLLHRRHRQGLGARLVSQFDEPPGRSRLGRPRLPSPRRAREPAARRPASSASSPTSPPCRPPISRAVR